MDQSDRDRIERVRKIEDVGYFLNEMHGRRNELQDMISTASPARLIPTQLRRRQAYRIGEIIQEVEKISMNLRYHEGADVPADLKGYFQRLRDSIPTAEAGNHKKASKA